MARTHLKEFAVRSDYRVRLTAPTAGELKDAIAAILERKANSIKLSPDLRYYISGKFIEAVTPYVPQKTGILRLSPYSRTGEWDKGRIIWSASNKGFNYAYKQYTHLYQHYTPTDDYPILPGPYWTEKVAPDMPDWEPFIASIKDKIIDTYKNG